MPVDFEEILRRHREKYPQMTPQDCGKLAYQSEYGPEHMAPDMARVTEMLEREWAEVPADQPYIAPEDIGEGLCRFYLNPEKRMTEASALLAELFCRTAREHSGTAEGLEQKLAVLARTDIPGMAEWLSQYREKDCPPVRHSAVYREHYHPRYRLLDQRYARLWPALREVWKLARSGQRAVVAVDGCCGSGKTSMAALIAELVPCNVLHMDDYYQPMAARTGDWEQIPGGHMDLLRFRQEVLEPIRRGEPITCRAFDCSRQSLQPPVTLPHRALTIVEGSYSLLPALREHYALSIFLHCSREEQLRRLRRREGEKLQGYLDRWIPLEERYYAACGLPEQAMLCVEN